MTWNIFEWIIFFVGAMFALGTNHTVRKHYKTDQTPAIPANTFALIQTVSVIFILISKYSPFNLIWIFLLSYILGFLALKVSVLQWIAWLYGYLLALTIPSNWSNPKE
jgi:hypothetical protein